MHSIPVSEERKTQLEALARQQGKDLAAAADEVWALGLEQHKALMVEEPDVREMLNRRYDDAVSGKAQLLDSKDVRRELAVRHAAFTQQGRLAVTSFTRMPEKTSTRFGTSLGFQRPSLASRPVRFWLMHEHLIAYAPGRDPLLIVAVIHGRQHPRTIARILAGRQ